MPDEGSASRAIDRLADNLDLSEVAVAASERPDRQWDVMLYFGAAPDQGGLRALVAAAVGAAAAERLAFDTVGATDWVKASLEGLAPVAAGRFIVHGRHDRARVAPNKIGIEIEAALAFGTGHHGTTRGCLMLLDHVLRARRPKRVLDLGAGTGVLAIAAARALRRPVLASDIDRQAVLATAGNARLNGVSGLVTAVCASGLAAPAFRAHRPFDLVLANILAGPLRQLAPRMVRYLAPGASVILSGLLAHQAGSVIATYRAHGLVLRRRITLEGWSSLLLQRR